MAVVFIVEAMAGKTVVALQSMQVMRPCAGTAPATRIRSTRHMRGLCQAVAVASLSWVHHLLTQCNG